MAGALSETLEAVDAELADVRKRLDSLYEALETSGLTLEVLSPRILSLSHREEQLVAARQDAAAQLEQRRAELPTTEEITGYVADFRRFLQKGTIPERKTFIQNFVEGIEVVGDNAQLTYTIPMPSDGATRETVPVLDSIKSTVPRLPYCEPARSGRHPWHPPSRRGLSSWYPSVLSLKYACKSELH